MRLVQTLLATLFCLILGTGLAVASDEYMPGRAKALGLPLFQGGDEMGDAALPSGLGRAGAVAQKLEKDTPLTTRGAKEAGLFRKAAPAVVLLVTDDGLGSGSLISKDSILTNWHVIKGYKTVAVVFKPGQAGAKIQKSDVVKGRVVKIDQQRDLALVKIAVLPSAVSPIKLGDASGVEIGADVHAIGHPTGETWTYTKGIISQIRPDYEWQPEGMPEFKADVIQTQTPINPGNSGGPLLADDGQLIGVNSFKASGEGINFAVGLKDIKTFLQSKSSVIAKTSGASKVSGVSRQSKEGPKLIFEGRNQKETGNIVQYDVHGKGNPDIVFFYPDDPKRPNVCFVNSLGSGDPDIWVYDFKRSGKWEASLIFTDKGKYPEFEGIHPDGKLFPTSYKPFKMTAKNKAKFGI